MTQVAVKGQVWNYEEIAGRGAAIMILHGWGRVGNEWTTMARELATTSGRPTFVVDLPGFGGSPLPTVKNIVEYSQLVADFCDYLGIKKVILIGHSLGGRVGIVLGGTRQNLIERLILVDPAGVKTKSLRRVIIKFLAKAFGWIPSWIREKLVGKLMDEDYRSNPALQGLYRAVVGGDDLRKYLPSITSPTTVVWGEDDPILPLSQTKIYRRLLPNSVIRVVWGAGHDPHLERYEQTLWILQEAVE